MNKPQLIEHYLFRLKVNEKSYNTAQAKKKNADLRKIVMLNRTEEKELL